MKTTATRSRISRSARSANWAKAGKRMVDPPRKCDLLAFGGHAFCSATTAPPGRAIERDRCRGRASHSQITSQLGGGTLTNQGVHQLWRLLDIRRERPHLACLSGEDRNAVPIQNPVRNQRRHPIPWRQDAGEIERIRPTDTDQPLATRQTANRSKLTDGLRERELFARDASDEAAAPNFAPRLQPPIDHQQLPPGRRVGFPRQQTLKHHAVTLQECPGVQLTLGLFAVPVQQRPPSSALDAVRRRAYPAPRAAQRFPLVRWCNQGTEPSKAIGRHLAGTGQLSQSLLHLGRDQAGPGNQLVKEGSTTMLEDLAYRRGVGGKLGTHCRAPGEPVGGMLPQEECCRRAL